MFPETDYQVWVEQNGVIVVEPVYIQDMNCVVEDDRWACAVLHDLNEVWVQRSASLYEVVGMMVVKTNQNPDSSLSRPQTPYIHMFIVWLSVSS